MSRRMKGIFGTFLALLAAGLLLAACGGDDNGGNGSAEVEGQDEDVPRVGIAMPNLRDDGSFGQATFEGLQQAEEELDIEGNLVEGVTDPQETLQAIRNLAQDNGLVIATSTDQEPAVVAAAEEFPEVDFVLIGGPLPDLPNASHVVTDWTGPGFVAGSLAAALTQTGTVGFIGGAQITPIIQGQEGFIQGATSADPSIEVVDAITGDFTDPTKARDAAESQIAAGADVIWGETDDAFAGIITAIERSGDDVTTLGAISPKCEMGQGHNLGDMLLNQSQIVVDTIASWVDGDLTNVVYDLQDPSIQSFRFCEGKETPRLAEVVEAATEQYVTARAEEG